jgi:D-3-phosphoglycerate dehydrogenase
MMWRVFLSHTPDEIGPVFPHQVLARLQSIAEVTVNTSSRHLQPADLAEVCRDMDAVVTEWNTGADAGVFERCPRLKVFARCAAIAQNVDLAAATRAGVIVIASPPQFTRPMVELIVGLMISLAYGVWEHHVRVQREGVLTRSEGVGFELAGKTVGVVGLGRIGRALAGATAALGMRVLASDPHVTDHDTPATLVPLRQLLQESRFVVVLARFGPQTRGLIGAAELACMRPDAFLINPSQGGIVDDAALAEVLRSGRLAGAAVDVFMDEPDIRQNPLWSAPRTIFTPHIAGHSQEGYRRAALAAVEGLEAVFRGRLPPVVANPEVLQQLRASHPRWQDTLPKG